MAADAGPDLGRRTHILTFNVVLFSIPSLLPPFEFVRRLVVLSLKLAAVWIRGGDQDRLRPWAFQELGRERRQAQHT